MMVNLPFILLLHLLPYYPVSIDSIVTITATEIIVHAGANAKINVYFTVKKGYHIQSNKVNDEFIIPTTLEIDTQEIMTAGKQSFPAEKKIRLAGTTDYLLVYDGSFKVTIAIKANEKIQKGKYSLNGKLRYQACDSRTCLSPKIIDFIIFVTIL
jgi:thioredoxin:protein disulfide reductase